MPTSRHLAAIMFTDVVGYTSLAQTDEARALRLLQEQEKLAQSVLDAHRGHKVKSTGDGLLAEFPNALDAVECAVDLQRRIHEHQGREGEKSLPLRVGIHLGDVQRRGADIFGDAVNIASRVEPLAEPGGICLSEPVYVQVRNKVPFQLERLGPRSLKGIREPMDLYRVVLPWVGGAGPQGGPVPPRLAVLPLTNISPDPKDEYFADGLTEELISVLSQIRGLRVIARTSVNRYKATEKPIAQIGAELGVSSVLEGSVRKADSQLRISLQLIDVGTEEHRWAQTYDRKLENVFAIQAEVAERTAGALKVKLLEPELAAIREKPTSSLAAYESYLRGIQAFQRAMETPGGPEAADREAVKQFEAAIREDPGFSAAHSYLANHLLGALGMTRPARDVLPRVRELVARALELNPNSSDAHSAKGNLAFQADLDWARAEAEFQEAIALNPSSSTARFWYAFLLAVLQRFDEARTHYHAVIELDPLWLLPRFNLAWTYSDTGDTGATITSLEKLVKDFGESTALVGSLAMGYALVGRSDEALRLVEPLAGASDLVSRGSRSSVLTLLGRGEEARAFLADWEGGRVQGYVPLALAAGLYALLGQGGKALDLLQRDYRQGDKVLWNVYQSPLFDPLREDARFIALLRAMNLPTTLHRPSGAPWARRSV